MMGWQSLHADSKAVKQKTNFCDSWIASAGSTQAAF